MRTYLNLIRSEAQRATAPAVLAVAQDRGVKKQTGSLRLLIGIALRCYKSAARIRAASGGELVLPGGGHKHEEVRSELSAASYRSPLCLASLSNHAPFDIGALRIVLRGVPLMWRLHGSRRLRPYCEILTQACVLSDVLAREPARRYWLIIGDLSPYLIALAGACSLAGHRLIYWQYSYLDFKHMPAPADIAVILNDTGLGLAVPKGHMLPQKVFWRPRGAIEPLRLDALETGSVGAVLNVHADVRALHQLDACSKVLGRTIEVRTHPNSRLGAEEWPGTLTKAPEGEPLEAFGQRHALVLGGNTQALVKLRVGGTPVVHCGGLDPLRFDHHGYVRSGILPGWRDPREADFVVLRLFYEADDHLCALSEHIGPDPENRRPTLVDLLLVLNDRDAFPLRAQELSDAHG
jgi:hypothetical protein